uniref:Uncharacterized protein n=1 Tax=Bombyx mori TaxID=7091 RepID=A0A8R2LXK0_BOMMO|nr:uncharacterized protein LOC105842720 isoform X2 [Bombyx mori]
MSQVTVSSSHRDAEINEVQTGNATLEESSSSAAPPEDTASYLQVVVEKRRRQRATASVGTQTPRRPAASSPRRACHVPRPSHTSKYTSCGEGAAGDASPQPPRRYDTEKKSKGSILEEIEDDIDNNVIDDGPARVCVYRVCGGECAAAREGARVSAVERAARRARRSLEPALAELLAAPRVLLALPVGILLRLHRCTLEAWWSLVGGCVREVAEGAVRPALAECAGGCAVPALRAARVLLREARATLRPLALALRDAAEAPARLFQALRLVHVAPCACSSHSHSHSHTLV